MGERRRAAWRKSKEATGEDTLGCLAAYIPMRLGVFVTIWIGSALIKRLTGTETLLVAREAGGDG